MFVFLIAALPGCQAKNPIAQDPATAQPSRTASTNEPGERVDELAGSVDELGEIIDGAKGTLLMAQGVVWAPDGTPSPRTIVTLKQTFRGKPSRWLVTRTDAEGKYVVRADERSASTNMIWAATADGKLGCSWVTSLADLSKPIPIELHGGETILHVRNADCQPIAGASVSVYLSAIEDMSETVPPNIRKMLTKKTDKNGTVRFPSQLSGGELGFAVRADGYETMARNRYNGGPNEVGNLFVLGVEQDASKRCAELLLNRSYPDRQERPRMNFGRPVRF